MFQPNNLRAKKLGTRSNISEHNLSREVVESGEMINKCGVLFMSMAMQQEPIEDGGTDSIYKAYVFRPM